MTLRDDINKVIKEADIKGFNFVRLTAYEDLLDRIAEKFFVQGRDGLKYAWLWEQFHEPTMSYNEQDAIKFMDSRLPKDQSYWFLASEESGKYWVAEGTGDGIIQVLKEMYCFEYYIIERKFCWIVCENHHGSLIQAGKHGIMGAEQTSAPDAKSRGV
jgi:hypothetical protein